MPKQRRIPSGPNGERGIRNPTGPRKFGGNKQQEARIKELNKKISDRKSYYKRKYGDETLLEVQTKGVSSFHLLKEYNAYIRKIEAALKQEINPTHYRNKHKTLIPIDDVSQARDEYKRINKIKNQRRKEINEHGVVYGGKILTVEEAIKLGDKRFEDLAPLKFDINNFRSEKMFRGRMESINEIYKGDFLERWDDDYRQSYLKALKDKIGVYPELGSDYTRLKEHIENMSRKDFMKHYYTKEFTNIEFLYDKTVAKLKINKLISEWSVPTKSKIA